MADFADFFGHVDPTDDLGHPETKKMLAAMGDLLDRLRPTALDSNASRVERDADTVSVSLVHSTDEARNLVLTMFGDEAVVSYAEEHQHFRSDHGDGPRQVGPLAIPGMVPKLVAFVEALMSGRIELHVWYRPMSVRTRSYWVNDAGERELFVRSSTLLPTLRRSGPEIRTFGYG